MHDPLVVLLKKVRTAHHFSQAAVAGCMGIATDAYRHIERGRRPLPDFRNHLVTWVRNFEDCVQASVEERKQILTLLADQILKDFSILLDDLNQGQ
jgi:transcriptional regulator with XRE-family HTH domain